MLKLFAVTLQIMLEIFLTVAKTPFILFLLHLTDLFTILHKVYNYVPTA